MEKALDEGVPVGVVLVDAGCGADTGFREPLEKLGLQFPDWASTGVGCMTMRMGSTCAAGDCASSHPD